MMRTAIVLLVAYSLSMVSSNTVDDKPYLSMASQLRDRSASTSAFQPRIWDFPDAAADANLFNTSMAFTFPLFSVNTQALTGSARSLLDESLTNLAGASYSNSSSASPTARFFKPRLWDFPPPTPGSNLFNTSLAFTIVLFTVYTNAFTGTNPPASSSRGLSDESFANITIAGYGYSMKLPPIGKGVVAALAIPAIMAGIRRKLTTELFSRPFLNRVNPFGARASKSIFSSGFSGVTENLLTFAENSLNRVLTVDGEECIKRSVCEAHSNPKKYGIIGLPLQLLFPPYSGTDTTPNISKYQIAARYGKKKNANCGAQYSGCATNLLDRITSSDFLSGLNPFGARASDSIFFKGFSRAGNYVLTFAENFLDRVPSINGEECIKRSVCEAHSNPKKYGIIALPLQLFFPPYSGTNHTSKMSKYQMAARYGKNESANCGAQYNGCVISLLDLINSFARMRRTFNKQRTFTQ